MEYTPDKFPYKQLQRYILLKFEIILGFYADYCNEIGIPWLQVAFSQVKANTRFTCYLIGVRAGQLNNQVWVSTVSKCETKPSCHEDPTSSDTYTYPSARYAVRWSNKQAVHLKDKNNCINCQFKCSLNWRIQPCTFCKLFSSSFNFNILKYVIIINQEKRLLRLRTISLFQNFGLKVNYRQRRYIFKAFLLKYFWKLTFRVFSIGIKYFSHCQKRWNISCKGIFIKLRASKKRHIFCIPYM